MSPSSGRSAGQEALEGLGRAIARRGASWSDGQGVPAAPPADRRHLRQGERERRRRRRARVRRNRVLAGSLVSLLVGGILFATLDTGGGIAAARPTKAVTIPPPVLTSLVSSRLVVTGRAPSLTWPTKGEAAVGVQGVGLLGQSPGERSVPIASLTKLMTAYVILQDHPLQVGQQGPSLTMTQADVAAWVQASQSDDSNAPVRAGEVLTEYQLLEALLIPSADNIADRLGVWDAGSDAAFVAKMNATARRLGLTMTHYADASGVSPGSRSTAADQAELAADLMDQPVVREIVAHPSVPFPVAGTLWNYNPALGVDGIVGIKSGFTSEAQGCLATAAYRVVGGQKAMVVTVSLGQPDGLDGAARTDEQLLTQASPLLVPVTVVRPGQSVARLRVPWSTASLTARAPSTSGLTVVGWPGLVLHESLVPVSGAALAVAARPPAKGSPAAGTTGSPATGSGSTSTSAPLAAGDSASGGEASVTSTVVGRLEVSGPAGLVGSVPLEASGPIPAVPAGWVPTTSG